MTNDEFRCWLEGCYELGNPKTFSRKQLIIIENHLNLVKAVDGIFNERNQRLSQTLQKHLKEKAN